MLSVGERYNQMMPEEQDVQEVQEVQEAALREFEDDDDDSDYEEAKVAAQIGLSPGQFASRYRDEDPASLLHPPPQSVVDAEKARLSAKKKPPPVPPKVPKVPAKKKKAPKVPAKQKGVSANKLIRAARQSEPVLVENEKKLNEERKEKLSNQKMRELRKRVQKAAQTVTGVATKASGNTARLRSIEHDVDIIQSVTNQFNKRSKNMKLKQKCEFILTVIFESLPTAYLNIIYIGLRDPRRALNRGLNKILAGISGLILFYFGLNWKLKLITTGIATYRYAVHVCDEANRRAAEAEGGTAEEGHDLSCKLLRKCMPFIGEKVKEILKRRKEQENPGKMDGGRKNRTKKKRRKSKKRKRKYLLKKKRTKRGKSRRKRRTKKR